MNANRITLALALTATGASTSLLGNTAEPLRPRRAGAGQIRIAQGIAAERIRRGRLPPSARGGDQIARRFNDGPLDKARQIQFPILQVGLQAKWTTNRQRVSALMEFGQRVSRPEPFAANDASLVLVDAANRPLDAHT